jgi:2-(1,2-epoxy-1,2-dihydrophenyl)acetyl-CoA isomerase
MSRRSIDSGTSTVLFEVVDHVGVITLNRPERRNALHREMYAPIKAVLADFAVDDDVGCIVITGAGSGFCAGGDVRDGRRRDPDTPPPTVGESAAALHADALVAQMLHEIPKLTLAAVNGAAVGAGLSIALACDLRIMSRSAIFVPGWSRLAFSGDFGGTWFLTRLLGPSRALEVLVTNETIAADSALACGLTNRVVDDERFSTAWQDWARQLAGGPKSAIAMMKANVRQALVEPLASALVSESERMARSSRTADHKEAVRAWLDKREPRF